MDPIGGLWWERRNSLSRSHAGRDSKETTDLHDVVGTTGTMPLRFEEQEGDGGQAGISLLRVPSIFSG